jgi:hypothetical protein
MPTTDVLTRQSLRKPRDRCCGVTTCLLAYCDSQLSATPANFLIIRKHCICRAYRWNLSSSKRAMPASRPERKHVVLTLGKDDRGSPPQAEQRLASKASLAFFGLPPAMISSTHALWLTAASTRSSPSRPHPPSTVRIATPHITPHPHPNNPPPGILQIVFLSTHQRSPLQISHQG